MSWNLTANASDGNSTFTPLGAGSYPARLTGIVNLGTQKNPMYGSEAVKVCLEFEILGETVSFGDKTVPRTLTAEYTLSLNKKATLYGIVQALLGRTIVEGEAISLTDLIGNACMINVIEKKSGDKVYDNIDAITQLMKGYEAPVAELKPFIFDFNENFGNLDLAKERLPKYQFNKIVGNAEKGTGPCIEYVEKSGNLFAPGESTINNMDEIPF